MCFYRKVCWVLWWGAKRIQTLRGPFSARLTFRHPRLMMVSAMRPTLKLLHCEAPHQITNCQLSAHEPVLTCKHTCICMCYCPPKSLRKINVILEWQFKKSCLPFRLSDFWRHRQSVGMKLLGIPCYINTSSHANVGISDSFLMLLFFEVVLRNLTWTNKIRWLTDERHHNLQRSS